MTNPQQSDGFLNSIYFRTRDGRCPKCGRFAEEEEETLYTCNHCATRFSPYVVLQEGETWQLQNT